MTDVKTEDILRWMQTTQDIIEALSKRTETPAQPPVLNAPPARGNLTRCPVRFYGSGDDPEVFLAAINSYKTSNDINDVDAISALPVLLLERAGSWWNTVKSTTLTWAGFQTNFRFAFGDNWTNSLVLQKWMQMQHDQSEPAELFISRCRDLLTHFSAAAAVTVHLQIDFTFTKLHPNLRLRMNRSEVNSFELLITKCRQIESAWRENGLLAPVVSAVSAQNFVHRNHQSTVQHQYYQQSSFPLPAHDRPVNAHAAATHSPMQVQFRCPAHKSDRHSWENCYQNPVAAARKQYGGYSHTNNNSQQQFPNAGYSYNNNSHPPNSGQPHQNNFNRSNQGNDGVQQSRQHAQQQNQHQQPIQQQQQPQQQRQQQPQGQTLNKFAPRPALYTPASAAALPQPTFVPPASLTICMRCGGNGHVASDCSSSGQPIRVKSEPTGMSAVFLDKLNSSAVHLSECVDTSAIFFNPQPKSERL